MRSGLNYCCDLNSIVHLFVRTELLVLLNLLRQSPCLPGFIFHFNGQWAGDSAAGLKWGLIYCCDLNSIVHLFVRTELLVLLNLLRQSPCLPGCISHFTGQWAGDSAAGLKWGLIYCCDLNSIVHLFVRTELLVLLNLLRQSPCLPGCISHFNGQWRSHRLGVRSSLFHSENTGSNPVGTARECLRK
jgi:hypothetical protein